MKATQRLCLAAFGFVTLACSAAAAADVNELGCASELQYERFQAVRCFADLPDSFKSLMLGRFNEGEYSGIADLSEPFNESDSVSEVLPFRRFVMASIGKDLAVLCYEHGGIGYHRHVVVLRLSHAGYESCFSTDAIEGSVATIGEIIAGLGEKEVIDNLNYPGEREPF